MAYTQPFTSITMNGTTAGGLEIWSAGFHVNSNTAPGDPTSWKAYWDVLKADVAALCATYYGSSEVLAPADSKITSVKIAHLGTDGKYLNESIEVEVNTTGGIASAYVPQAAIVNSLLANKFKDPGKYNRFYLPVTVGSLGGTWRLDTTQQTAYANKLADFISSMNSLLNDATLTDPYVVVVASAAGAGSMLPVTKVRIGGIVDTQRRRRNKLPEAYVEVVV